MNSLGSALLHLTEGPARLNAEYRFSYIQGAITLSKPHKVKGFRFGLFGVPLYFISKQCATFMYACLCHFKERMIVVTFKKKKKNGLYWQLLVKKKKEKGKPDREEKRTLFCPLAFVSGVVDVFFCGSVRMYVTQTSSIFVLSLFFFFFFFPPRSHIHTHVHTHRECILKCCWLGVETLAMGEAPVRLGNLRLFVLKANLVNNGGGCSGEGGSVGGGRVGGFEHKKNGVHHVGAGGSADSKRFSCLLSGGRQSN